MGLVYLNFGNDLKALEYLLESLQAAEQLNDKLRIATACMNIGTVYLNKASTLDKAEEYYLRALPISEELGDLPAIGTVAVNLGELAHTKNEYGKALVYYKKALDALQKSGGSTSFVLSSIGKLYAEQGLLDKAIQYHNDAIKNAKEKDAAFEIIQSLNDMANSLELGGNYSKQLQLIWKQKNMLRKLDQMVN